MKTLSEMQSGLLKGESFMSKALATSGFFKGASKK